MKNLTSVSLSFQHNGDVERDEILNALLAQLEDLTTVSFIFESETEVL